MAITREKKEEIVLKLKDVFSKTKTVVFVNFHGLTVKDITNVRKKLRENDIKYFVTKKTLTSKALEAGKIEGEIPVLDGELGIAYGDDKLSPAREVYKFSDEYKLKFNILGGIFDGKFIDKEKMTELGQIPDIQTLRAQFVNIINSPIQGFASVIHQIAESKN